jgi:DNA-binding SARP family transcriptional activator
VVEQVGPILERRRQRPVTATVKEASTPSGYALTMLRLRLVGEIAAEAEGVSRTLPPGRPRALLAWLALRPGLQPRAAVASAFWPDVLDDSARASLRSALWALRRSLGEDALVATRDRIGLPPETWVDVLEADRLGADGDVEGALELCDGPLLPGIDDEWALEAQDEHRERLVRLLEAVAAAAERDGDLRRAVALTRRQAALEPLSEEIHRSLMRRLDASGDRGAALAEYNELRTRLVTRLRTGPSRETQQLAEALRDHVASPAPTAFPVRLLRADRAAFVGRERELARIDAAWRRAVAGGGAAQVVLLAGEAGIGKSRIVARFAAEAGASGATVLYGACEEQSLVPYAPFSEAVGGRAPEREEIETFLTSAAEAGPLVLALDDLHLADRNTLALLARVARGTAGDRLLVLGAYRDADAVGTPLLGAIADLRRDCDVERVAIEGLSVDEVDALLDGAADARRIHDRTDGNPFFVRELARYVSERREVAGGVPESVSDVVLARVARLTPAAAETLLRASVLGESFDLAVLERFDGPDRVLDALDEAAAAGLLEDGAGGRYRFAHALTRDAVYGSIGAGRRSDLHRRAAAALEVVHGLEPGPELGEIAIHLCIGAAPTDRTRAVELAEQAAGWAGERDAWEQVVTLLTRALAVLDDADVERRRRLMRTRAIAYARLTHALVDPQG